MKKIKKSGQICLMGEDVKRYGPPSNKAGNEKSKKTETFHASAEL